MAEKTTGRKRKWRQKRKIKRTEAGKRQESVIKREGTLQGGDRKGNKVTEREGEVERGNIYEVSESHEVWKWNLSYQWKDRNNKRNRN